MVFHHLGQLIGINLNPSKELEIPSEIQKLVDERTEARGRKDWGRADQIRQELLGRGYLVEDREGRSFVRSSR